LWLDKHPAMDATTFPHPSAPHIAADLELLLASIAVARRVVRAGDVVFEAGSDFEALYVVNAGFFKTVSASEDGREQIVALSFKGDWLGCDGIAAGRYGCDVVAIDTGEVWAVHYGALLCACVAHPQLMQLLHCAMSREIGRDRDFMVSLCTLPADARVAHFLRYWADALAQRGLRTDNITLRMSRAEIGNYLGMTLETVSRALSRLARVDVIRFNETSRRDIHIPRVEALVSFIQATAAAA
jgi:CRP/FNR family transcriptional regulator